MRTPIIALTWLGAALGLSGCAAHLAHFPPAQEVTAVAETQPVGTANQDAADDPAIWHNRADPAQSLIVGTDKKAGLYVYGLDGAVKSFSPSGQLNNVALVEGRHGILVAASDRTDPLDSKVAVFTLDPQSGALTAIGSVPSGPGEAYGLCMAPARGTAADGPDRFHVFAAIKDGTVREIALSHSPGEIAGRITREWKIATQIEGCVVDPANNDLFVGEETAGIWRIDLDAPAPQPVSYALIDNRRLVADVEGLAIAVEESGTRYLIASSQGDNAYAVYNLSANSYAGRFRIVDGAVDATSETDGIDVVIADFGPAFPGGLFVAQDGDNGNGTQNFKLVAWDDIKRALQIP